jgi:hypothetical protein
MTGHFSFKENGNDKGNLNQGSHIPHNRQHGLTAPSMQGWVWAGQVPSWVTHLLRIAWIKGPSQCAQKELSVEWQVHDTI